jgi:hypothetical protein
MQLREKAEKCSNCKNQFHYRTLSFPAYPNICGRKKGMERDSLLLILVVSTIVNFYLVISSKTKVI